MTATAPVTEIPQLPDPTKALEAMQAESTEATPSSPNDPKAQELYDFAIDVVDGAGKRWTGTFKNRILTIAENAEVGILAARLSLHTPFSALDPETAFLLQMQAHLTISLDVKRGGAAPRWFKLAGEGALRNTRILHAVYREVAAHEAFFRGAEPNPGEGEG